MFTKLSTKLKETLALDDTIEYSINVIGNGSVSTKLKDRGMTSLNVVVNCGNTDIDTLFTNLDLNVINIIKSKHALKHIGRFSNHSNVVHIVPQSYNVPQKAKNVVRVTNEQLMYNNVNLLLHPASLSLLLANSICNHIESTRIIGYTFDVTVRNKESLNSIEYDAVSFTEQKRVLDAVKSKLNIKDAGPISCKTLMREKIKSADVIIIAEITTNHGGDVDKLCNMALLAKHQGADIVKIQKRDLESIYSVEKLESTYDSAFGTTLREYRAGLELTLEELQQFDAFCAENRIPWFASILDEVSLDLMRKTFSEMDVVKLPSTISNNEEYILKTIQEDNGLDIVISTGMTDKAYVEKLLQKIQNTDKNVYLVHAVSCYPTPLSDVNIGVVSSYTELSNRYPNVRSGFSGHDIGSLGSILSVGAGATIIEKHIKYGPGDDLHYGSVALDITTDEFKNFVKDIRIAKQVMGSKEKEVLAVEYHKYE